MRNHIFLFVLVVAIYSCGHDKTTADKNENSRAGTNKKEGSTDVPETDESTADELNSIEIDGSLPMVKAVGGEGTNINWAQIKADEDPDGPGYFYFDCDQGVRPVKASSVLAANGKMNYGIENLNDFDPMTAWIEGKEDYGIGEYFEISGLGANVIYNGYQSTPQNWKNNSRVKLFKVFRDGKAICYLELTDEMGRQHFELPDSKITNMEEQHTLRFEIVEVYPGDKWKDVAVSHIDIAMCCFAAETQIIAEESFVAKELKNGLKIISGSPDYGKTGISKIEKWTMQKHLSLIRIETENRSLMITGNHPLFIKDHGCISLDHVMEMLDAGSYEELIGKISFEIYDEGSTGYENLKNISVVKGEFETYTIQKLSDNNKQYVINGFITKTY